MDEFKSIRRLAATLGVSCPASDDDLFNVDVIDSINRAAKRAVGCKLAYADASLIELCKNHGVKLSITGGEIVLVDNDCLDNELVIDELCHI